MTKEQKQSLQRYVQNLKDRLTSPIPRKHTHRPTSYHQFLRNEIATAESKLEAQKIAEQGGNK